MKINKNSILAILLLIENIFVFIFVIFLVYKIKEAENEYLIELFSIKNYFLFNPIHFISTILVFFLINLLHILLWYKIFQMLDLNKDLFQSAYLYFKIHTKRLFSPFGPISPIINLESENRKASLSYLIYVYFVFLGSFLFFSLIFSIFKVFLLLIVFSLILIFSLILKIRFFKNIEIYKFLELLLITFLIESLSFYLFYLSNTIFLPNIKLFDSFIAYLIWVIVSSVFPILYGTGTSEGLSLLYIYYLGYNPTLFLFSLIYYRLITTYLPILGLSIKYFDYLKKNS